MTTPPTHPCPQRTIHSKIIRQTIYYFAAKQKTAQRTIPGCICTYFRPCTLCTLFHIRFPQPGLQIGDHSAPCLAAFCGCLAAFFLGVSFSRRIISTLAWTRACSRLAYVPGVRAFMALQIRKLLLKCTSISWIIYYDKLNLKCVYPFSASLTNAVTMLEWFLYQQHNWFIQGNFFFILLQHPYWLREALKKIFFF